MVSVQPPQATFANGLTPLLKWPGGKSSELALVGRLFPQCLPKRMDTYYEPFLGGGAFWLAAKPDAGSVVNDLCPDLMDFYGFIKRQDCAFFEHISLFEKAWSMLHSVATERCNEFYEKGIPRSGWLDTETNCFGLTPRPDCQTIMHEVAARKLVKFKKLNEASKGTSNISRLDNVECALKDGYYTYLRSIYNGLIEAHAPQSPLRSACFYMMREYSFSSMFRFSSYGDFNVPYGGIAYNSKNPSWRLNYWKSDSLQKHLKNTEMSCGDFLDFLRKVSPKHRDFIFIDPPYDSNFKSYDNKDFDHYQQERLAGYLAGETDTQFLVIVKKTPLIESLYCGKKNISCETFNKNYAVNMRNRNERSVEHLLAYRVAD